ncbi:MAG: Smr/MutS family protein [Dysgonamonadaceae bacterium]|jgi:DNA mismatch repair protein MutS2|nr:Smr/MutS family protein [Dysgonamonadaceae bacterium]
MIYPENFEQKTGFDKIRSLLSEKCLSNLGEEKALSMSFSSDYARINRQLHQTEEFVRILQAEDHFPSNAFYDLRPMLNKIRIEGAFPDERELFDLGRSLQTIHDIVRFFERDEEETPYPYLKKLTANIVIFPSVLNRIDLILDKFGRIKDNASTDLSHIRQEMNTTLSGISKKLQTILRHAQAEGWVEKDVNPSMRDGRLVIPVAPASKRKIKGIVHDESSTGKTIFIEPAEVVEANNKIRELESEERREIVRILTGFSDFLRPVIPEILKSYEFLAGIDFIRAKALFAIEIHAIRPALEDARKIDWHQAAHPLLLLSLRRQKKDIVPLDITLSRENGRILVISGPNAGGKSVCLQTVGLLQYMLQCGMLLPVGESSKAGIFRQIFIDIGDEQSIEDDLSTYSSHLKNMKFFVRCCNPATLFLIDEFGSGTEPLIGGAIAEALLKRFNEKQSFGVITTHYQNLKHFADDHDEVVNAAMLYDRNRMQALFQLSIGHPGSSFAVEIARKTGLPEDVIADATAIVGSGYVDKDKYLQDIVRDKLYWETKRQNIRSREKKLDDTTLRYETNLRELEKQRKEILLQATSEAQRILSEANARIENTIREIKEAQADRERTKTVRKTLEDFKSSLENAHSTDDKIARKVQKIKEKEQRKQNKPADENRDPVSQPEIIRKGDSVRLKGQTSTGTVLEVQNKQVTVAFGMIKSTLAADRLEKTTTTQTRTASIPQPAAGSQTLDDIREKKLNFRQDIDLRGMYADEALQAVMYFIDDAVLTGVSRVRILHGTGTGALRQIVRDYLKTRADVRHFHDEHIQFGGSGITVVDLS